MEITCVWESLGHHRLHLTTVVGGGWVAIRSVAGRHRLPSNICANYNAGLGRLSHYQNRENIALPHEVPKLAVSYEANEQDFATLLDQRIKRSQEGKKLN
jgi:hypothetical protein